MRLILFITLMSTYLFGVISLPMNTPILSINDEQVTTATLEGVQVGMYGAIIRRFDESHSTALSWAEITKIDGSTTTLALKPILTLEQNALPTGKWTPKVGDEVIIGYNYQRALLIAPNSSIYNKITRYHNNRQWVHPDIFTAALSAEGHPTPIKEDFSRTCRLNNIGLVFFMFDKSIITVDCHSFKILENKSTSIRAEDIQLPFYSRVPHIEANWFGEGSSEMTSYAPHYIELLAENNSDNKWIQSYKQHREEAVEKNDESWLDSLLSPLLNTFEIETENFEED